MKLLLFSFVVLVFTLLWGLPDSRSVKCAALVGCAVLDYVVCPSDDPGVKYVLEYREHTIPVTRCEVLIICFLPFLFSCSCAS